MCLVHSFSFYIYISLYFFLFINSPRCLNNKHKDHENSYPDFDFERSSCVHKAEFKEDIEESDLPPEMLRLLTMEDKQILPHQEVTELVNLGTDDEKKEVKIALLREYADIFAWSYQDMSGLSTKIVEHQLLLRPECQLVQQKLRKVKPEILLKIKEEVKK